MTVLHALAESLGELHDALTAPRFAALVLFDVEGREVGRAGGREFAERTLAVTERGLGASISGLPDGLAARFAPLVPFGTPVGRLALIGTIADCDEAGDALLALAAALARRLASLDYELADLAREVAESYEAMTLLFDVTSASSRARTPEELGAALLEQLCRHVHCRGALLLFEPGAADTSVDGPVRVLAARGCVAELPTGTLLPRRGALAEWLAGSAPIVLDETAAFRAAHAGDPLASHARRTLLVAPLVPRDRAVGVLVLFDRAERPAFDSFDKRLADAVASHAGAILVGLRMAALEKELEIGRRIQQSLLPAELPAVAGLDVAGRCSMAHSMGGDFFDVVRGPGGDLKLVIADVSGHDLGAALFMAAARAQFHTELALKKGPGAIASRLNGVLHADLARAGLFLTYCVVAVDPRRGRLVIASGGHNPALLLHRTSGVVESLPATGLPAGLSPEATIGERRRPFGPGDLLLLYTDGLTEAAMPSGELFGEARLGELLVRHRELPAAQLVARIEEEISAFRGGAPATDDETLLLLKAESPSEPKQA